MTGDESARALEERARPVRARATRSLMEPRSVAVVGASDRPGTFGARLVDELRRSSAKLEVHLVNPRRAGEQGYLTSLDDISGAVDLVLLGVADAALELEMTRAARRGDRSAVVFASAHGPSSDVKTSLRDRIGEIARASGMALCGGGCMGFVNVSYGLRAIGYTEAETIRPGPIAVVTHSGSVFSALLRTHRGLGFTVAVSSGQELGCTAADYVDYALDLPETRVVALFLETLRAPEALCAALERAATHDVRVVALTVGGSPTGRTMVAAHSGALAGDDGAWEALFRRYGVTRVHDLDEMTDTLELFAAGRRARSASGRASLATVHDSGAERALVVDVAHDLGLGFAPIGDATRSALSALLDPGLVPENPLDVWGTGAKTAELFSGALRALAEDDAVGAVALAVDLVHEHDGDDSYIVAGIAASRTTTKPFAVLSNVASAVDPDFAARLRGAGVPVLEGTRSGLLALRHLLDVGRHRQPDAPATDPERRRLWLARLAGPPLDGSTTFALAADYGIGTVAATRVRSAEEAVDAAQRIGWPVVLKTDMPEIAHKSDVGGVVLGLTSPGAVVGAYRDIARRLGPEALVTATAPPGVEIALGLVRDPALGLLLVVGAGGLLVEMLDDRAVSLLPVDGPDSATLLGSLRVSRVLSGVRGRPAADVGAVERSIVALGRLGSELGEAIDAFELNPVVCSASGAVAVDALLVGRSASSGRTSTAPAGDASLRR